MSHTPSDEERQRRKQERVARKAAEKAAREEAQRAEEDADLAAAAQQDGLSPEVLGDKLVREAISQRKRRQAVAAETLIISAVSTEYERLEAEAEALGIRGKTARGPTGSRYTIFTLPDQSRVASLQLAGMGPSYAVQGYLAGKNETGASAVLLVGIAFGIDSAAQKHGDVLVSQRVLPCDERNVTARQRAPADPTWLPEWDYDFRAPAIEASPTLTRRVEIGAKSDNWTIDFGIHAGTLLSGGARIESSLYLLHLLRCASGFAPIIGGDMETAILASLARNDEIDWITIKGISDFAEESRNTYLTESRVQAASNAARTAWRMLLTTPPATEAPADAVPPVQEKS